jgi:hypothetical protein
MRKLYALGFAAMFAAAPAMADVVISTPNYDSGRHEQRAMQDRMDAHQDMREAQTRAAMGDYQGAAEAQRDAHHDMRNAQREERKADSDSSTVIIGR